MSDEVWKEYEEQAKTIIAELKKEMRGPGHPGMFGPDYLGRLYRLQKVTAEKLGATADDFADRFGPDEAKVKSMCGIQ